ncbi:hypothetical protein [Paenibacillus sp. MMS18-CY102]|uniref:hypothetical protein n=1 Tax=Paenibacillus sp. MMS18-CY102 TaxID=2682849 RepID=UPI00136527E3|nr:hypothetical protein [Paenibacillus sp. MMS18-CY102]MWC30139.1 hypothetical protein [Paenibacillus sp. MMS18-CY102]
MAISQEDRRVFEDVIDTLQENPSEAGIVLKVLFTFLKKTTPVQVELQEEVKQLLEQHSYTQNKHAVIEDLKKCWSIVINVAQEEEVIKSYTTGQLAKFFGVSITTINKWIASDRLIGVERTDRFKQARISENVMWVSPTGEKTPVYEVVERYHQNNQPIDLSDQEYKIERIKEIVKMITFFEERYGGTYQKVLKSKGDPYQSEDWQWGREGKEWQYLLKEIGDL